MICHSVTMLGDGRSILACPQSVEAVELTRVRYQGFWCHLLLVPCRTHWTGLRLKVPGIATLMKAWMICLRM